jgi:hypothetical protein
MTWHKKGIAGLVLSGPKIATIGAAFYLLAFACASLYPLFDHRTFSGLIAVLLGWPWIDYLPSALLPLAIALNTVIIYVLLAFLSTLPASFRRLSK